MSTLHKQEAGDRPPLIGFMLTLPLACVLNDRNYEGFWDKDRIRVIVGADLLKVFANKSAEAL